MPTVAHLRRDEQYRKSYQLSRTTSATYPHEDVSPPARLGHAICVVPLQCDRSRNTGSPVMPACWAVAAAGMGQTRNLSARVSALRNVRRCPDSRGGQITRNTVMRDLPTPDYHLGNMRGCLFIRVDWLGTNSGINLKAVAEDASLASVINPFITGCDDF